MVDVPGNTTTTVSLAVGGSYSGVLEKLGDHDWIRVSLTAGKTYRIDLVGSGSPAVGDTYLRFQDWLGRILRFNDDFGAGSNSQLTVMANAGGTYYIDVASYGGNTTGNYTVTLTEVTGFATMDAIATQLTTDYWTTSGDLPHHFAGTTITYNVAGLTAEAKTLARLALGTWADATGLHFTETTSPAQITLDDFYSGAYTDAVWDGAGVTSTATVNIGTDWLASYGTTIDSYSFQTYVHEIGHALGLGHAGNYNGDATYPADARFVNDSWQASIMSYFSPEENTEVDGTDNALTTPMIADVIAIQSLYGAATTTRTGDTVYGYNCTAGDIFNFALYPTLSYTIVDNGGVDTLDFSQVYATQIIDLRAGNVSNVGEYQIGNVGIARGVVIENAVGGFGADWLLGNGAANRLDGRGGADVMRGFTGDDVYVVDNANDRIIETANGGYDTALVSVTYRFGAYNEIEKLAVADAASTSTISLTGNEFGQRLEGNAGINQLNGALGADDMWGFGGDDVYFIDNVGDQIHEAAGGGADTARVTIDYTLLAGLDIERLIANNAAATTGLDLTGNELGQSITGDQGANVIDGKGGADTLTGLGGDDLYFVDQAKDVIREDIGGGFDEARASASYALRVGVEVERLTTTDAAATTAINLTGNEFAQTVVGNAGGNRLYGADGNDVLTGGAGADHFYFTTALGPANVDTITDFSHADDTIWLDDAVFVGLSLGLLSGTAFVAGTAAVGSSDRIVYDSASGAIYFDSDGFGGVDQVRFATVAVGASVAADDFRVL
ncbi:MAG: M10 family metallopeptidase C-terminal domain-containing protein [Rhizobiales bacterium]|nr:M10 family metallopeptidase C-terminal domain-containing protein [Hyphomicrobiales bacterium]